ncbi:MAG: hypothetical protein ABIN18_14400 [Pseudomonadota bacterium]
MEQGENIKPIKDKYGITYYALYTKSGEMIEFHQHLDALMALQTGHYTATKPVEEQVKKHG